MKIGIETDGSAMGTKLTDLDTEQSIFGVSRLELVIDVDPEDGEEVRLIMERNCVEVHASAFGKIEGLVLLHCPNGDIITRDIPPEEDRSDEANEARRAIVEEFAKFIGPTE